ncbi:hypothetical protein CEY46_22775 [Salmonella enterica subsp. enterica serovar Poona]|nr:hypothetical protein [Salmonella enterica subsp. enterica serovar Poona]EDT7187090.1 hypothetical protein [Salmonella enterica subsp. enterica]
MAPSYAGCKKYTVHKIQIIHTIQLIHIVHTIQNLHTLLLISRSDPKTPEAGSGLREHGKGGDGSRNKSAPLADA